MSGFADTVKSVRLRDGSYLNVDFDHESRSGDFADEPHAEDFENGGGYYVIVYRSGIPGKPDDLEDLYNSRAMPGDELEARDAAMEFSRSPRFTRLVGRQVKKVESAMAKRDRESRAGRGLLSHVHQHPKKHHGGECGTACRTGRMYHQHKHGERHAPVRM